LVTVAVLLILFMRPPPTLAPLLEKVLLLIVTVVRCGVRRLAAAFRSDRKRRQVVALQR
jgi:hypothetical protein